MDLLLPAYLTGLFLGMVISLDSLIIFAFGRLLGTWVQEVQIFFMKLVQRKFLGTLWTIGWFPTGSSVRFPGLAREDGEEPKPYDFDQAPLGNRIAILLIDKVVYLLILVIALVILPTTGMDVAFEQLFKFFIEIFSRGSEGAAVISLPANHWAFILAGVSLWALIGAIIPWGGNKTQMLLLYLFGVRSEKAKRVILTIGMIFGGAFFFYTLYCFIRYVNIEFEGQVISAWISIFAGLFTMVAFWSVVLLAFGKPLPEKPEPDPSSEMQS